MGRAIIYTFILAAGIMLHTSCSKEGDTLPPFIEVESPFENQMFSVGDTIRIRAEIQDDHWIEYVEVSLENSAYTTVQHKEEYRPSGNAFSLDELYPLYDTLLPGGDYFIRIKAFDGENFRNSYTRISVEGIPRRFQHVLILVKTNPGEVAFFSMDTTGIRQLFSASGDYSMSSTSIRYGLVSMAGASVSPLNTFSLDFVPQWTVNAIPNPPFPYFTGVGWYDGFLYTGHHSGYISIITNSGSVKRTLYCDNNRIPLFFSPFGNYIAVSEQQRNGNSWYLALYYQGSGILYQAVETDFLPEVLEPLDPGSLLCFGNRNGQAVMKVYDVGQNNTWEPSALPLGLFHDAARISGKYIMLSVGDELALFNTETLSAATYLAGYRYDDILYEDIGGLIIAAADDKIAIIGFPQPVILSEIPLPGDYIHHHLVYNKEKEK